MKITLSKIIGIANFVEKRFPRAKITYKFKRDKKSHTLKFKIEPK